MICNEMYKVTSLKDPNPTAISDVLDTEQITHEGLNLRPTPCKNEKRPVYPKLNTSARHVLSSFTFTKRISQFSQFTKRICKSVISQSTCKTQDDSAPCTIQAFLIHFDSTTPLHMEIISSEDPMTEAHTLIPSRCTKSVEVEETEINLSLFTCGFRRPPAPS